MAAPWSNRTLTASALPEAAASMRAVVPLVFTEFAFAPALSSVSITAAFPLVQAMNSGVMAPSRVAAFTFAPAASKVFTISRSSLYAAQCSAVAPSPWAAFTSAFCFSRERTASLSFCMTASASRVSPVAAKSSAAIQSPPIMLLDNICPPTQLPARKPAAGTIACPTSNGYLTVTVTERFDIHAQLVQHGQRNIRHRSGVRTAYMQIAFQLSIGVAGQENRHALVVVNIAVAHGAAIQNHRMVQQIAVTVRRVLQLLQEVRQQADMVAVEFGELRDFRRILLVMRARMKRSLHSALRKHARTHIAAHLERGHSSGLRHESQDLQIEHQPDMLFV